MVRSEHRYRPSSSSVATTSAGARSTKRAEPSTSRTCSRPVRSRARAGGHLAGLPVPGSGPSATVEGGSGQAQRPARRRHADPHGQFGGGHRQFFPSLRFNPGSPATFPCTSMIVCAVASSFSSRATLASSWRTLGPGGLGSAGLVPRFFGAGASGEPLRRALRHTDKCELYKPSRRSSRPISPGRVQRSASSRIRKRYSALNWRRFGFAATSGPGARTAGAAPAPGASSLRSSTPGADASASLKAIESPLPLIVVHLHRPTLIPRVVDVSTILADRAVQNGIFSYLFAKGWLVYDPPLYCLIDLHRTLLGVVACPDPRTMPRA